MTLPVPDPLPLFAAAAALFATLFATRACAQEPAAPPVERVLAAIDAARGRSTAARDTLLVEGTYSVRFGNAPEPVATGAFHEWFAGTENARHRSDMGPMGAMERGITKDLAWEVDPAMGAKVRRGPHAAAVRRWFAILRGSSPRGLYRELERTGTKDLDGVEVTVLRGTPAEGKPDLWYVDGDGVVRRVDIWLPAPESADATFGLDDTMEAQVTFAEHAVIQGQRHARQRTLRMGPATVTFACTTITPGVEIAADRFTPPEAVGKAAATAATGPAFDAAGKPTYQVVDLQAQRVASIRLTCKPDQISATLAIVLPEVMAHLQATGARMAGPPFSRYHAFGADSVDLEAGMPVHQPIQEKGRVKNGELPAGKAVTAWHVGPYDGLGASHGALREWALQQKHTPRSGPWEVYWTDPGMVPDQAKWRTQLFLPIESR